MQRRCTKSQRVEHSAARRAPLEPSTNYHAGAASIIAVPNIASLHYPPPPDAKLDESLFQELKSAFMDAYDSNKDGRLDIKELAQLLPLESGFQLLFKFENQVDSSVEFMRVSQLSRAFFSRFFCLRPFPGPHRSIFRN